MLCWLKSALLFDVGLERYWCVQRAYSVMFTWQMDSWVSSTTPSVRNTTTTKLLLIAGYVSFIAVTYGYICVAGVGASKYAF